MGSAPLVLSCPVCGTPHPAERINGWAYLVCPRVAPGTMIEVDHAILQAILRRVAAPWN